jgi:hypothetical protein
MKLKTKYSQFVNEKYNESPDYSIKVYFDELESKIRKWFDSGVFASNKAELSDIKRSNLNEIEKCMIVDFTDNENYFQIYFILSLQDVGEESLDTCYVKVKKYETEEGHLLGELGDDVDANKLSEDKIITMLSSLNDKLSKQENGENETTEENDKETSEEKTSDEEESDTDF